MELPITLKVALELLQSNMNGKALAKISAELSASYIKRDKVGGRSVTTFDQAAVYALARMPATYGAVYSAIAQVVARCDLGVCSLLDVGAGTGAASQAARQLLDLSEVTCLERESSMAQVGRELMSRDDMLRVAGWVSSDMVTSKLPCSADIVIAAYSLNELAPQDRESVIAALWEATRKVLIIVEPGTPECYGQLMAVRNKLLKIGAKQLAPCAHSDICPVGSDDWCHFSCRIARSKIHKMLKGGECPYEDEKYCYMAFSREEYPLAKARVLRHPIIEKERVRLRLCTANGIMDCLVRKGDKAYKVARKASAGDEIECGEC